MAYLYVLFEYDHQPLGGQRFQNPPHNQEQDGIGRGYAYGSLSDRWCWAFDGDDGNNLMDKVDMDEE